MAIHETQKLNLYFQRHYYEKKRYLISYDIILHHLYYFILYDIILYHYDGL